MARRIVLTDRAPKPIGPYSQAVLADGWLFCSGQIPLDPATGQVVGGGAGAQAERCLRSLQAVLEAAGSGLDRVLKTTVYLANMDDFARMNALYSTYFTEPYPARTTIQAARLPMGINVEIEAIAARR